MATKQLSELPEATQLNAEDLLLVQQGGIAKKVQRKALEGGTVTSIDFTNFANGSFTETVDGEEVSHTVTFDESGRPVTVDGVTIIWPTEKTTTEEITEGDA